MKTFCGICGESMLTDEDETEYWHGSLCHSICIDYQEAENEYYDPRPDDQFGEEY